MKKLINELKSQMPDFTQELMTAKEKAIANALRRYKPYTEQIFPALHKFLEAVVAVEDGYQVDCVKSQRYGTNYKLFLHKPESLIEEEKATLMAEIEAEYAEQVAILQENWLDDMLAQDANKKAQEQAELQRKKYEELKLNLINAL